MIDIIPLDENDENSLNGKSSLQKGGLMEKLNSNIRNKHKIKQSVQSRRHHKTEYLLKINDFER